MARSFASASSMYGTNAAAPVTAMPLTLCAWVNMPVDLLFRVPISINSNSYAEAFTIYADATTLGAYQFAGGTSVASTIAGLTAGTWTHVAAVFASTTSRTIYKAGVAGTENTTSKTAPAGLNTVRVGLEATDGASYWNGLIAEAAVYSVALSADDIASLASGFSPLLIRPDALAAYWPLIGAYSPEIDVRGNFPLTLTNTPTQADHCRVLMPRKRRVNAFSAAAAAQAYVIGGGVGGSMIGA